MTAFFDHYTHFALGVGERFGPADEGGGPRDLPPIKGDPKFAEHVAKAMVADEFDLSYLPGQAARSRRVLAAVGAARPTTTAGWPTKLLPIVCGVLTVPLPRAALLEVRPELRRAIQSYPEDIKVAIVGTGGLSHQVHGERNGFNNTEWDMEFMDRLEKDPEGLLDYPVRARRAGRLGGRRSGDVDADARRAGDRGKVTTTTSCPR